MEDTLIRDDSHAHGILKRELRCAHERFNRHLNERMKRIPRSKRKLFQHAIDTYREAMGECVLIEDDLDLHRATSKRRKHVFIAFDRFSFTRDAMNTMAKRKFIPIVIITLDSKDPWFPDVCELCIVSEHVLERMIRRNQCHRLSELMLLLSPVAYLLLDIETQRLCEGEDYMILLASGFFAVTHDGSAPVLKTWIPREWWKPHQEAKLLAVAEQLGSGALILEADYFNQTRFLDPAASIYADIPGGIARIEHGYYLACR